MNPESIIKLIETNFQSTETVTVSIDIYESSTPDGVALFAAIISYRWLSVRADRWIVGKRTCEPVQSLPECRANAYNFVKKFLGIDFTNLDTKES